MCASAGPTAEAGFPAGGAEHPAAPYAAAAAASAAAQPFPATDPAASAVAAAAEAAPAGTAAVTAAGVVAAAAAAPVPGPSFAAPPAATGAFDSSGKLLLRLLPLEERVSEAMGRAGLNPFLELACKCAFDSAR